MYAFYTPVVKRESVTFFIEIIFFRRICSSHDTDVLIGERREGIQPAVKENNQV